MKETMKGKRSGGQNKRWEDNIKKKKKKKGWTLPVKQGHLKTGLGGNNLVQSHIWSFGYLARLWDRAE